MTTIDTRSHFEVPVTVTVKVQDANEATELVNSLAARMVQTKGVSLSHRPVVGSPAIVGGVTARIRGFLRRF